jgi:YggT family protein
LQPRTPTASFRPAPPEAHVPVHIGITVILGTLGIIGALLNLFMWAVILSAVISTLLALNVLDSRNRFVWSIADFLYRICEPVLRPMRRRVPTIGNIDISALIVILVIVFILMPLLSVISRDIQSGLY